MRRIARVARNKIEVRYFTETTDGVSLKVLSTDHKTDEDDGMYFNFNMDDLKLREQKDRVINSVVRGGLQCLSPVALVDAHVLATRKLAWFCRCFALGNVSHFSYNLISLSLYLCLVNIRLFLLQASAVMLLTQAIKPVVSYSHGLMNVVKLKAVQAM